MLIVEIQFHWKKEGGTVTEQRREWRKKEKPPPLFLPSLLTPIQAVKINPPSEILSLPPSFFPHVRVRVTLHISTQSAPKKESLSLAALDLPRRAERGGSAIKDCCCVPSAQPQIRDPQESVTFVDSIRFLILEERMPGFGQIKGGKA